MGLRLNKAGETIRSRFLSLNFRAWMRLCLFGGAVIVSTYFSWAFVKNQTPLQLLRPVDQGFDQTPAQAQRLQQITSLPTTRSIHLVRVNQNALADSKIGVSLPGETAFTFMRTGGEKGDSKSVTWAGAFLNGQIGEPTLVSKDGEITGSTNTPRGLYLIDP